MACFRPRVMQQRANGTFGFGDRPGDLASVRVACGKCVGCQLDRSAAWSLRCQHEASLYDLNCFVTLTYDDEHVPADGSLRYPDVQGFLKRLRARSPGDHPGPDGRFPIRFFCAGEYGSQTERPHYHLLLFNFDFSDRKPVGKYLYESETLADLWPHGLSSVGSVTPASASYVAQYCVKKLLPPAEGDVPSFYGRWLAYGGRAREFVQMSRRPGLGSWWYQQFGSDVLPRDFVVDSSGKKHRVPRFYQERFRSGDESGFGLVKELREEAQLDRNPDDRSFERLAAGEVIAEARLSTFSKRGL